MISLGRDCLALCLPGCLALLLLLRSLPGRQAFSFPLNPRPAAPLAAPPDPFLHACHATCGQAHQSAARMLHGSIPVRGGKEEELSGEERRGEGLCCLLHFAGL